MMKILIVSDTLLEGGAEIFSLRLCSSLVNMGMDATLLSMNAHHENKKMTSRFKGINIKRLKIPFVSLIEKIDHWLFRIGIDHSIKASVQKRQLKKWVGKYEIIHTNFIRTDFLFSELKKDYSFKHVVTVHGDYSDYYYRKKGEEVDWLQLEKKLEIIKANTDQFVVVSDEQTHFFEHVLKWKRIIKIYNGYTAIQSSRVLEKSGKFIIGMMGRGHPLKGWEILINTFKQLPEDCELYLAGDSDYLDGLKNSSRNDSRIHFEGYCNDIEAFYKKLDVFVLPTLFPFESLPTVIIESLFYGVPVIATDTGEIGNMLIDTETNKRAGFLLNPINGTINSEQLKEQLLYMYNNPSLVTELRDTAKKAFAKFEMSKCVSNYLALYERLLKD